MKLSNRRPREKNLHCKGEVIKEEKNSHHLRGRKKPIMAKALPLRCHTKVVKTLGGGREMKIEGG